MASYTPSKNVCARALARLLAASGFHSYPCMFALSLQGSADSFLSNQLTPGALEEACKAAGYPATIRMQVCVRVIRVNMSLGGGMQDCGIPCKRLSAGERFSVDLELRG
eukprot:1162100-Pelagomonas_calceolata.AAC.16